MSTADTNKPPMPPPILPPTINEEVFAPKRQMNEVKQAAAKRLKKLNKKFEKIVRKFFKKAGEKERYLQFYDIGYRFEAVFEEVTSDGITYLGEALTLEQSQNLPAWVAKELKLTLYPSPGQQEINEIYLTFEKNAAGRIQVLQLVAGEEYQEIKRLAAKVENAPRANNPGA